MKRNQIRTFPHEGVYARIKPSKIHGVGVFAIRHIPKGTKPFGGDDDEVIWIKRSALDLEQLPKTIRELYDHFCVIKEKGELYGCPRNFNLMTIAWYLNHSNSPNIGCDEAFTFFALRQINEGEELTTDYRAYNDFATAGWL
jgi:SET domain-containing protein